MDMKTITINIKNKYQNEKKTHYQHEQKHCHMKKDTMQESSINSIAGISDVHDFLSTR